jgi:hypothetical protein
VAEPCESSTARSPAIFNAASVESREQCQISIKEEPVSFLRKWFGREEPTDVPINLDVDRRKEQLLRLERALDALAAEMRADHTTNDPAWRERINEYSRLASEAMDLRRGTPTRETVLDLVFEIRPLFTGPIPEGMEKCGPLQQEVMAAAADLRDLLPGEKGSK